MPPRLARLVAIVAAIALVGGAFVLRGVLAGDDEGTVSAGGPGGDSGSDGPLRIICDEDLGDACDAIAKIDGLDPGAFEVMSVSEAVEAMTGEDATVVPYDVWITLDPWPQILDVAREQERLTPVSEPDDSGAEPLILASSTPVILTSDSATECDAPVDWGCLAMEAADGADIGLPTLRSAAGTLVLANAASGLIGETDFGIDEVRDITISEQLNDLLESATSGDLADQATEIVTQRGKFDALATIDGLATDAAGTVRGQQQDLTVFPLEPPATLGVVVAPIGPDGPSGVERLRDLLNDEATGQTVTNALADAGWSGPATRSDGLPDPDLLYALNEEFQT